MNVLVTGASGYIGSKLANMLAENGNIVHAFVRSAYINKYLDHPLIRVFKGDILNKKSIDTAMKNCRQVYHTAALVKLAARNRDDFYQTNVGGTINVLECAMENDIEKMVHTSSCGVWSGSSSYTLTENDPRINSFHNDYDLSKYLAEQKVKDYGSKGLCTIIVNPSRVFGPGAGRESNGVNRFLKILTDNKISFIPCPQEIEANYAYIDDVVKGHVLAMEKGVCGERYILGGHNISYARLFKEINNQLPAKHYFIRMPSVFLKTWYWYELIKSGLEKREPAITTSGLKRLTLNKTFDCSKAVKQLGYSITPFEESLKNTIQYFNTSTHGKD